MKTTFLLLGILSLSFAFPLRAQQNAVTPDLSGIEGTGNWITHNREASYYKGEVHLDGKAGDGLLWLKEMDFENGTISLDIKGRNEPGRSFVGMAFHGLDESTYDAIYFRPFNFQHPERKGHAVQYISHPEFTWHKLREEHSGEYENAVNPVPDPEEWFHVSIEVEHPVVKVYVNHSDEPSLTVQQISSGKRGFVGFWVGNGSEGAFRNLTITSR